MSAYAELHCISNFTFLRGASHPEELVHRAAHLGYRALALTDECSLAGVVRAHRAATELGLHLIVGSEFRLQDGPTVALLAPHRLAYAQLSALISLGRTAAPKGRYRLTRTDLDTATPDCLALLIPGETPIVDEARWFADRFGRRGWLAVELLNGPDDNTRLTALKRLGEAAGLPLVACGDVHMHRRSRRALQDVLTGIRLNRPLPELGRTLLPNGERYLRPLRELAKRYPASLLTETCRIADQCRFSLNELRYEYPAELVPPGQTPSGHLRQLTQLGARRRWPSGVPEKVREQIDHELKLIAELRYEPYFLTVHDMVGFARGRNILCQGRGSAANSAVCFCLGITEVDPARMSLLFERFISRERKEPPDIDVDFEHQRREEVIQYVYRKYGRHRTALAATVITYRPRSALRDAGKALGLEPRQLDRLSKSMQWWDGVKIIPERLRETGFDPENPTLQRLIAIANELLGFPRHLSQHVGGLVISQGPLTELAPIENAAMKGRSIIQWDKDDLDALGLLKVDCLALGMLTAIHKTFDLLAHHARRSLTLSTVPSNDSAVYRMIQEADTVGVFQIESRAQMAMLPRLKPKNFYDLVIEIAIVRPGPIQGDMVHPYLRRREGLEPEDYPSPEVEEVLKRTMGVPIFQEQVMRLAIVAAGFSPGQADQLRRSMAAWRRRGGLERFEKMLIEGMDKRGYSKAFAHRIFRQIQGFGEYGFPESHAASFALLAYVSAWLKCHEPAAFTCALLNSQPMGFYAPSQLIQDVRRHGVEVRPIDITASRWDCTLEPAKDRKFAVRLGLRLVKGLSETAAERLVAARDQRPFDNVQDLSRRAELNRGMLTCLAQADALRSLAGHRRKAWWAVLGAESGLPLFKETHIDEKPVLLPTPNEGETLLADYRSTGLTLRRHPLALLRPRLRRLRMRSSAELLLSENKRLVRAAGIVIARQRPGSASGVTFVTLEDETGIVNVVVWRALAERQRNILVGARLMGVIGIWEKRGKITHLIAGRLEDHSHLLGALSPASRDFH